MDKKIIGLISVVVVALLIGMGVFLQSMEEGGANADPNIVSLKGIHWHPELEIFVKGAKQVIPANMGLPELMGTGLESPIHTHDSTGVIHLEFAGVVHQDDLKLGEFFKVWKKDMRSFGTNMKMTVNGVANTEFENYHMKDKDKIVLTFD